MANSSSIIAIHIESSFSNLVETLLSALKICESALVASIIMLESWMPVPILAVCIHPSWWWLRHWLSVIQVLQVIKCQHIKHRQEDPLETFLNHISLPLKFHNGNVGCSIRWVEIQEPLFSTIPSSEETRNISPSHNLLAQSFVVAYLSSPLDELRFPPEAAAQ